MKKTKPFLAFALPLLLATLACSTLFAPRPEVTWDNAPDKIIVKATYCCGYAPELTYINYIPDAQLWGDGRYVWTTYDDQYRRSVHEAHLTPDEMETLLRHFVDEGFFGLEDSYADYSVTDHASQCLRVNLASASKSVCEYYEGAPKNFHQLYGFIHRGPDLKGAPYVPPRGYLTAFDYGEVGASTRDLPEWPADAMGFSLAEAAGGMWVEGAALEFAWQAVNVHEYSASIQENGISYGIGLEIPDLGMRVEGE